MNSLAFYKMACYYQGSIHTLFNLTSNESNDVTKKWNDQRIYLKIFISIISCFILTSNFLLIWGILRTKKTLRLPQKMFLISSCCGLVTGLTQPYYVVSEFLPQNCLHEVIGDGILMTFLNYDFLLLATIGIFRFISIVSPLTRINGKLVIVLLLLEFLIASLMATFGNYAFSSISSPLEIFQIYWFAFGSFYSICICIGSALIAILIFTLRRQHKKFIDQRSVSKHGKAVKRICLIQLVYIITNLPVAGFCLHYGLDILDPLYLNLKALANETILACWLFPLSSCNCAVNALIYMYFSKDIRNYYLNKLGLRRRRGLLQRRKSKREVSFFSRHFIGLPHNLSMKDTDV